MGKDKRHPATMLFGIGAEVPAMAVPGWPEIFIETHTERELLFWVDGPAEYAALLARETIMDMELAIRTANEAAHESIRLYPQGATQRACAKLFGEVILHAYTRGVSAGFLAAHGMFEGTDE